VTLTRRSGASVGPAETAAPAGTAGADLSSRYFEPDLETMARSELARLQEDRLLDLLPYAYERSALLRWRWQAAGVEPRDVRSMEDFVALAPFVDKDDIRAFRQTHDDPFGGMLCVPPDALWVMGSTSGTSGDPTPLPQQRESPFVVGVARDFWEVGARPGDVVANVTVMFRVAHGIERFERLVLSPIFINQGPDDTAAFIEGCRRFRPVVGYVLNNLSIGVMASYEEATGDDLAEAFASCEGFIIGGEPLSERTRDACDRWGVRCHEMTTLGDVCGATACREGAGMHAWEDLALVEHLQLDGTDPAPDGGRGELVVTSLTDRTGPIFRYRTGDVVELTREPCACGRTHARLWVIGRRGDEVVVDGRSILPRDVWPALEALPDTPAALFQLIRPQRECDVLRIRVGHADREPRARLAEDLADLVEAQVGVRPVIQLVPEEVLLRQGPPHKIPRVSAT
jgi:phenylacetate-CoA ligase